MISLLRLCRVYYAAPMSLILTLTIWYALGDGIADQWTATVQATIALALVIAGGYALNDVCDQRADRTNAPGRPLPAGRVRPRVAVMWSVGLLGGGLAIALLCRWQFFLVLACVVAVVVVYDLNSKRLGLGKQLLVAALMTSFYPLAFAQAGMPASSRATTLYVFPCWIFLTSFGYETLKDLRDMPGDRLAARHPSWVQRRPQVALAVARITIITGAITLLGPALVGCGWVYRAIIPGAIALGIWSIFLPQARARMAIYGQFVIVGIAAVADVIVPGC